jgi:type III secretion protein D
MGKTALRYQFSVESGLHAGVADTLAAGTYRIGRALDADIVLADGGLAPVHGSIEVKDGALRVAAMDAPVVIGQDGEIITLAPGTGRDVSLPALITLGETQLRVDPLEAPKPERKPRPLLLPIMLGAALPVLLFMGIGLVTAPALLQAAPRPAPVTHAAAVDAASRAADALNRHLNEAGLGKAIHASVMGAAVLARGSVDAGRNADWLASEAWYDQVFAAKTPLLRQVAIMPKQAAPSLSISAIWAGDDPHIMTRSGEKLGPGAIVDGGWKITKIDHDGVQLERDGRTMTIGY